jgi:archaeal type IV pilus assembly protein PilA
MKTATRNPLEERAVSPVIGVVLMVGVTVVLAGVTGTFLLGFGDMLQESPQAGVTFDGERVTYVSSGNADGVVVIGDEKAVVLRTVGASAEARSGDVVLAYTGSVDEPKSVEDVNAQADAVAVVRRL